MMRKTRLYDEVVLLKNSSYEQFFQPHFHYANYRSDLYARCRTNDDDDFELLVIQHGID